MAMWRLKFIINGKIQSKMNELELEKIPFYFEFCYSITPV